MITGPTIKNTAWQVVIPFYCYAGLAFLSAALLLIFSAADFTGHYFHPHILAITHIMALGWGTMIILGAGHQLIPVLIEGRLYSDFLAYASLFLAGIGIPFLAYGFYNFNLGFPLKTGGILINAAVLSFLVNAGVSISQSKKENVHAAFVFTASLWLLLTTSVGLLLVYNFTSPFLPADSLHYLSLHAHLGIAGWFLLLIIGVGSRLIPMFMISKYSNPKVLWTIFALVNVGLLAFVFIFLYLHKTLLYLLPIVSVMAGIVFFGKYCYTAYKSRIRKQVDEQVRLSLLSVSMMVLPVVIMTALISFLVISGQSIRLALLYGFTIFFGWITAIILGMTFKTLPFIVWNKVYHKRAGTGKTPNPKDLFSSRIFNISVIGYLAGFIIFAAGILMSDILFLKAGTVFLLFTAVLYNLNVWKLVFY